MANPNPDLYTIRIGADAVKSPNSGKPLYAGLTFEVVRKPVDGKSREGATLSPHNLVLRPGDYVAFEIGEVTVPCDQPRLKIEWKAITGKEWPEAPTSPGKPVQIPPKAGFACQLYSYSASLDLGVNAKFPAQKVDCDNTVVTLDPDFGTDEC